MLAAGGIALAGLPAWASAPSGPEGTEADGVAGDGASHRSGSGGDGPEPPAEATVTIIFEGGDAGFQNTLGYYHIDPETGQITGVGIAFENASPEFGGGDLVPGTSTFSFTVPAGAQVGVFLIANGNNLNDYQALGPGSLVFQDAEGAPATLQTAAPQLVHVAPDGTETPVAGPIYHSAGSGPHLSLNPDGAVHVQGLSENEDGTWTFGFEDLPQHMWDADYDDVVFTIAIEGGGTSFLNPDYEATAPLDHDNTAGFGEDEGAGTGDPAGPAAPVAEPGEETDHLSGDGGGQGAGDESDSAGEGAAPAALAIVPCFSIGTLIETDEGPVPVEELMPGDRVRTRDHGLQRLRWVGQKVVTADLMRRRPDFTPVRVRAGALGPGCPARDMLVSPQHRFLISGPRAELLFGAHEVLVAATHLAGTLPGVERAQGTPVTYVHIMCDRHELVLGDAAWSESFQPGDLSLAGLDHDQRDELFALFPELATAPGRKGYTAARLTLKAFEARALLASGARGATGH